MVVTDKILSSLDVPIIQIFDRIFNQKNSTALSLLALINFDSSLLSSVTQKPFEHELLFLNTDWLRSELRVDYNLKGSPLFEVYCKSTPDRSSSIQHHGCNWFTNEGLDARSSLDFILCNSIWLRLCNLYGSYGREDSIVQNWKATLRRSVWWREVGPLSGIQDRVSARGKGLWRLSWM